jgi:hypothetical protein
MDGRMDGGTGGGLEEVARRGWSKNRSTSLYDGRVWGERESTRETWLIVDRPAGACVDLDRRPADPNFFLPFISCMLYHSVCTPNYT